MSAETQYTVESESAAGWMICCAKCGTHETFPQVKLADALLAMHASGRWDRRAPMALQDKDLCAGCARKAGE